MSTINVSNLNDGTTTVATTYITNGSAKALFNYTESGSFSVAKSFNVASEVDNGNGDVSYTLTSAMSDANYITSGEAGGNLSTFYSRITSHHGSTSTVVRMRSTNSSSYTTNVIFRACSAIFGDLA
tara:strand:+ start:5150 stop:5527 length:378 start_codon:yes stop_codon:yes gene_type:complete